MKSGISIIAIELAGLLITFVLSAIIHTSVLLVNPTFNISLRDKSGDSNDRFLIVELRKQGPEVKGQVSVISNQQSVTVGKQSMVGRRSSAADGQKGKAKNIAKPAKARYKQPLKEVKKEVKVIVPREDSHSMPEKTASSTSIAHNKIRGHENPHPPLNPLPSLEGGQINPESHSLLRQAQDELHRSSQGEGRSSGQTLLSGDPEESSSKQTSTEVAHVDPIQPVTEEPKRVPEAENDTEGAETVLASSNITEVQPSPDSNKELEEVKDREEERPVAHVDTNVMAIREEALNKTDDTSAQNEIETEREDVAHAEIDSTKEPSPVNETASSTKGDGLFSGQTFLSGDPEESSSKQTSTEVAHVDPIQPDIEEPKIVDEAANDTEGAETVLASSKITEVQPSPDSNKELVEVKDREEERPVADVDTNVMDIREEALNKAEDTSDKNEIEAKKDEVVETGAAEVKIEDGHKTSSEEKPIEQIAKAEVAEKVEEPAKVVEQIVEPKVKKKKRIIPFHKMLEPEKDATIGIPIGRPVVKITAPSKKKVSSRVQDIGGKAQGNGVSRVTLSTNGENAVIPVQNGRFLWDTVLREGKNTISATAWDMEGYSASDSITVEVLTHKNSFELSIDEPAGELESPIAIVRGRVGDLTVDTVKLIVNGEFVETPVDDGYFEKTVFLKERENTLQAEAVNSAGLTARSGVLKVAVKNPMVHDILLHLLCEGHDMESHPKVTLRERSRLDAEKGAVSDVNVVEMMSANEGYWEKVFAVEEARDGAYTLKVSEGKGTDCKLVVTLNSSKRKVRVFEKRVLEGEEWAVGRFLLPEGIFWDEDEWFSGRIEDKDSISKYRSPEGVTWKELKVE